MASTYTGAVYKQEPIWATDTRKKNTNESNQSPMHPWERTIIIITKTRNCKFYLSLRYLDRIFENSPGNSLTAGRGCQGAWVSIVLGRIRWKESHKRKGWKFFLVPTCGLKDELWLLKIKQRARYMKYSMSIFVKKNSSIYHAFVKSPFLKS